MTFPGRTPVVAGPWRGRYNGRRIRARESDPGARARGRDHGRREGGFRKLPLRKLPKRLRGTAAPPTHYFATRDERARLAMLRDRHMGAVHEYHGDGGRVLSS